MGGSEKEFEVIIDPDALKDLERIPLKVRHRIVDAIEILKANPFGGKNIVKLRGDLAAKH